MINVADKASPLIVEEISIPKKKPVIYVMSQVDNNK